MNYWNASSGVYTNGYSYDNRMTEERQEKLENYRYLKLKSQFVWILNTVVRIITEYLEWNQMNLR